MVVPHNEHIRKMHLKNISAKIIQAIQPDNIARLIIQQTKIIYRNRKSIAYTLINNVKQFITPGIPPKCLGPPYCNETTHYSKPLYAKDGISAILKHVNANMIPRPDNLSTKDELYKAAAQVAKASLLMTIAIEKDTNTHSYQSNNKSSDTTTTEAPTIPKKLEYILPLWNDKKEHYPYAYLPYSTIKNLGSFGTNQPPTSKITQVIRLLPLRTKRSS